MNRIVLSFTVCLLLSADAEGGNLLLCQKGHPTSVRLKNISRYDKLGPYEIPVEGSHLSTISAEVRGFIWEHWTQQRLGYVIVTSYSKEGEPSTSHMFIEPDETGIWHLSARIERKLIDRRGFNDPEYKGTIEQYDEYKAYTIERIEMPGDGVSKRIVIHPEAKRRPESYRLIFKGKDGKVITEW